VVLDAGDDTGSGIGLAKGVIDGTLLDALPRGTADVAGGSCGDAFSPGGLCVPGSICSGAGGFIFPQGFVGAKEIFGFGGSGLATGCGAGIALLITVLRGSPSCTNQQSLPKLQCPFKYRSHGRVPIRSGRLFFPR